MSIIIIIIILFLEGRTCKILRRTVEKIILVMANKKYKNLSENKKDLANGTIGS